MRHADVIAVTPGPRTPSGPHSPSSSFAGTSAPAIERILRNAQRSRRDVVVHVNAEIVRGIVVALTSGRWVELRPRASGRVFVRIARIAAIVLP